MSSKIKIIIAIAVVVVIGVVAFNFLGNEEFEYNDENAIGNTNGNLYNEGLFCEDGEYIYFANPNDKYRLYRMNKDGSGLKLLYEDTVSYINVCGDYIYYKRNNKNAGGYAAITGNLYGIYRISKEGGKTVELHRGVVGHMMLSGNYIYYRELGENSLYHLSKVKIDGSEEKKIHDSAYVPGCLYNQKIYFAEVVDNHNLKKLDTKTDRISDVISGNIYMPDIYDEYVYYIDCDNKRKLTRENLVTGVKEVLSEDKVVNYNMSIEKGVIFYQAENDTEHKLVRIKLDGSDMQDVITGDCANISITSMYTYFYKIVDKEKVLYRTPTTGIIDPVLYSFK